MSQPCYACPHQCGAKRGGDAGTGFCGMGETPRIARAAPHFGEEPCISGTRGSGTVFFSGCSLRCVYCQNASVSQGGQGTPVSVEGLGAIFASLKAQGVHNINLVNPTHFAPWIAQALGAYPPGIPVVYNSGGFERVETLRSLSGLIDVYLPDIKYTRATDAAFLSGVPAYPEYAKAAILEMVRQTGPPQYDAAGLMVRGTLVRHLVLPGMTARSMEVLNWLHDNVPGTPVSLMGQYTPCHLAKGMKGLDKPLTDAAYARVAAHARAIGLLGYQQPPDAAGEAEIPVWDGTGVCGGAKSLEMGGHS